MNQDELKEIFLAEALEAKQELDRLFTLLEKNHSDKKSIDAIFRITHTLKANAAGMGYNPIAEMAHTLEDVFSEIRKGTIAIEDSLFADLFKANDVLAVMFQNITNSQSPPAKYKGIKTKLEVQLRKARLGADALPPEPIPTKTSPSDTPILQEKSNHSKNKIPTKDYNELPISNTQKQQAHATVNTDVQESENKLIFSDLVQIPTRKLDQLMNLVGELIIERDRISVTLGNKGSMLTRLQRITSELQYSVMDTRLVQVNVLFSKFHRIVRDTAAIEQKKVNLILEGTNIEVDRSVLQTVSESLVHVVRNAISHGIESPETRLKKGKPEYGTVTISAINDKEAVQIIVKDDGKGINSRVILQKAIEKGIVTPETATLLNETDIISFIFEPGFSSADTITEVSGRGVGMDVVKRAIDSIGGRIEVHTEIDVGSQFCLTLPASMSLKSAMLFELSEYVYAIPLAYTKAVVQYYKEEIHHVGRALMCTHLNNNIPVVFLNDLFLRDDWMAVGTNGSLQNGLSKVEKHEKLYVIIVAYGQKEIGFVVDKPLQQKEIVEKPLKPPLDHTPIFTGATILGNGHVCLVLDVPFIVNKLMRNSKK